MRDGLVLDAEIGGALVLPHDVGDDAAVATEVLLVDDGLAPNPKRLVGKHEGGCPLEEQALDPYFHRGSRLPSRRKHGMEQGHRKLRIERKSKQQPETNDEATPPGSLSC